MLLILPLRLQIWVVPQIISIIYNFFYSSETKLINLGYSELETLLWDVT